MDASISKNKKNFIGAAYNNKNEFVNITYEADSICHMHWNQGGVYYDSLCNDIKKKLAENFFSQDIVQSHHDIGSVIKHVWRPGLNIDINTALEINQAEYRYTLKKLRILIDLLNDILLYIEPDSNGLNCHGHKLHELLILSCIEVESVWKSYMDIAGITNARLTTREYVKLKNPLKLDEYKVIMHCHPHSISYKPFEGWDINIPTQTLPWYNAYNITKHDKNNYFDQANLKNCILAIMANLVLFCVRYSPYKLLEDSGSASRIVNDTFTVELDSPDKSTFYIPNLKSVVTATGAFSAPLASQFETPWKILPLTV